MTGVILICYNNVEFLLYQEQCFKKYCTDYELIVIDNSSNKEQSEAIRYHSGRLRLQYLRTTAGSVNGSDSHAFAAGLAYTKFKDKYEILFFTDHDSFLIKKCNPAEILGGKLMAGLPQIRGDKKYFWPGCFMFRTSVEIGWQIIPSLDTGGGTYKAIEQHGEDACVFFNEVHVQNPGFNKSSYNFYALINDGMWLHFVNGSNWAGSADNEERINSLFNLLIETCK